MREFFVALEKYYKEYLWGYTSDANTDTYDMDMQLTKDRIEQILKNRYILEEDIEFLKSLIPDIENNQIKSIFEEYLQ